MKVPTIDQTVATEQAAKFYRSAYHAMAAEASAGSPEIAAHYAAHADKMLALFVQARDAAGRPADWQPSID